jgi:DNA-binding response OmpR family regulator
VAALACPISILLVEDERHLRRALARSLAARGFHVDEAATRGEAVQAALAQPPTLMVLDVNLPDASGWDVLRDLVAQGQTTPTVIMSAAPPNPSRVREFASIGVLTKPFSARCVAGLDPPMRAGRPIAGCDRGA